jgi:hypothetical protein
MGATDSYFFHGIIAARNGWDFIACIKESFSTLCGAGQGH